MRLFHSTSRVAAALVTRDGFRDAVFMQEVPGVVGVCVSDRPLDAGDGVARSTEVCFVVSVPPGTDLSSFEVVEERRPSNAYREWLVPAEVLNTWPRRIYRAGRTPA